MTTDTPQEILLSDYTPPEFLVETIDLEFRLAEAGTMVKNTMKIVRNPQGQESSTLQLDGSELQLNGILLDGKEVLQSQYQIEGEQLFLQDVPKEFVLEINTEIKPQENTSLEGLYKSSGNYCTQCEAQGFRKITYSMDRPDVMAKYSTKIIADKLECPVLLSNGNLEEKGDLEGGLHFANWVDPFPKPSYLFALVAGALVYIEDKFQTMSGREVTLQIFVEKENIDKCDHAMASLIKSMKWEEEKYGREYDLDIFMIVAVNDFNMGAMENKGLNIFNSKYILACPETATDMDYINIEAVIAHEYFHNWTGNRITLRDWFHLSLKEGLTVFRDQEFTSDMTSRAVKRITDVRVLRSSQFPEDSGPMAHPVRPESFVEINNFYTVTIYNKGAEVVRMIHNILGWNNFRKGMEIYFNRHDGQAVIIEDFVRCMEEASDIDLDQFKLWYSQAGTPEINITQEYIPHENKFILNVHQSCPSTPGQELKKPFLIPFAFGLVGPEGKDLPLQLEGESEPYPETTRVLQLSKEKESFEFININIAADSKPIPSVLRDFSAPVKLKIDRSDSDLSFLMANDENEFNRFEASHQYALNIIHKLTKDFSEGKDFKLDPSYLESFREVLDDPGLDKSLKTQAMFLPSQKYAGELMEVIDVDGVYHSRDFIAREIAQNLESSFKKIYTENLSDKPYDKSIDEIKRRSLKNICLSYLAYTEKDEFINICFQQFQQADNMTDQIAALGILSDYDCTQREQALDSFYEKWKNDSLVLDKWFSIQAFSRLPGRLKKVKELMKHPAFDIKNPNKVRSLIGGFCAGNTVQFHDLSGEGYQFLADQVLLLNGLNPQVASRMTSGFSDWRRYDSKRQELMKSQLLRIQKVSGLSRDVYEIVTKSLK